jgi:phage gpG-like protein
MIDIGIEIRGASALKNKFKELGGKLSNDVTLKGVVVGSMMIEDDAKLNMGADLISADKWSKQAHEIVGKQKLSNRKLFVREGFLRASITKAILLLKGQVVGTIGTNSDYGRIHELGGFAGRGHKSLIPARPFLLPALLKNIESIKKYFKESFWAHARKVANK